ncbi:hypothetical protein GCM10027190_50960 [Spirosoma areae]
MQTYSLYRLHKSLCEQARYEWDTLTKNCNVFAGVHPINQADYETENCNIFLPVNYRKRYNNFDKIEVPDFTGSLFDINAINVVQFLPSSDEERRCEVTRMPLHKDQPRSSKVVGITTLKNNPDLVEQFRQRYGRKKCKRAYYSEEYRLAHGPRNEKSNGPNNLRRRVNKAIQNTPLFPAKDVIRLTADQQATLTYFAGTPYEVKLS